MKLVILSIALAASTAFAAEPPLGKPFEVRPQGCLMKDDHAACVFVNHRDTEVTCDLEISANTQNGMKLGNTRRRAVRIGAFVQTDVYSTSNDPIISVTTSGTCGTIN
jgi:hypothetical protein